MSLRLRDHIHWCNCTGRAVFLDAGEDRYFCLPQVANDAFLRLAHGETRPCDVDQLQVLVARGILLATDQHEHLQPPPHVEPATCDFSVEPGFRPALPDLLGALVAEMRMTLTLRSRPLVEVLAAARNQNSNWHPTPMAPERVLLAIVAASTHVSFVTRAHDRCLVRALTVHSMCRRAGIWSKLVFGVNANPFAAHSWVQYGRTVLVGGFEQTRLFTPILVLE